MVVAQAQGIARIVTKQQEIISIITTQSVSGSKPQEAPAILNNTDNRTSGKALFIRYLLEVLSSERLPDTIPNRP